MSEKTANSIEKYFQEAGPHYGNLMRFLDRTVKHYSNPEEAKEYITSIIKTSYRLEDNLSRAPLHVQLANYKNLVRLAKLYGDKDIEMLERLEKTVKREEFIPPFGKLIAKVKESIEKKGHPPSLSVDGSTNTIPFNEMIYRLLPLGRKSHQEIEVRRKESVRESIEESTKRQIGFKRDNITYSTGRFEN